MSKECSCNFSISFVSRGRTHTHTHTHTHPMCNDPNFHMHGSVRWEGGPSVSPPSARPSSSLGRRGAWPWGERRTLGKTESPSEDVLSLVGGGLARPDGPDCQRPGRGSRGTESDRERGGHRIRRRKGRFLGFKTTVKMLEGGGTYIHTFSCDHVI